MPDAIQVRRLLPSIIGTIADKPMKRASIGAGYGLVLLLLGIIIAGGGHGIMTFLKIAGAPLPPSLLFLAVPLMWAGLAFLTQSTRKWVFPAAMLLHYAMAVLYTALTWGDDFNDPYRNVAGPLRYFAHLIACFVVLYFAGQIWLWYSFARSWHSAAPSTT